MDSTRSRAMLPALVALVVAASFLTILAPRASAGTAILFLEDFEDGTIVPDWSVEDSNPLAGEDYWGISDYRANTGNYSAWAAQVGNQSIGGQNNSDVHLYDDDMQADLTVDLQVNGFDSLTLYFYYYSRTESGGGDWIQAWYEAGGVQFPIFNNTGGTGNRWDLATVAVPNNVERLIIRFHSDGANHGFEGAYVDDVLLTGVEDVPPTSAADPMPTFVNDRPYEIAYAASDNANASGVDYVELWYRRGTTGNFTLYTRPANPLGQWITPTIPFDVTLAAGDGYYELYTVAVDRAGNAEAPPATPDASVTIDTLSPTLTVTSPQADAVLPEGTVNVSWQGADALSGIDRFETSLDGGAFVGAGLATSRDLSGLAAGSHTIVVRAYDRAGNVRDVSVDFTIQAAAPGEGFPWLWILLLLLVVIGGILFFLWWRRDREEKEAVKAVEKAAPEAPTEASEGREGRGDEPPRET